MIKRMTVIDQETEAPGVVVGAWPSLHLAYEHALVVLAMRVECWVMEEDGGFALHVDERFAGSIRRELDLYEEEQRERVTRVEPAAFPFGFGWLAGWGMILLGMFLWQLSDPVITERFCNSSIALVDRHEWWRPFTALFLHGGVGHLLGNIAIGGVFCLMVAHTLGAWRGWLLVLTAGTLGNALNAWIRYPQAFESIGASTMTFAALGVLVGVTSMQAWKLRSASGLKALLVPMVAGLVLLSWFGTAGENTDVGAHFAGWSCGFVGGLVRVPRASAALSDQPL